MAITKPAGKMPEKFRGKAIGISFAVGFGIAALWGYAFHLSGRGKAAEVLDQPSTVTWGLLDSAGLPLVDEKTDLALMNLRCCPGIGTSDQEIRSFLHVLEEWAQRIAVEPRAIFPATMPIPMNSAVKRRGAWR